MMRVIGVDSPVGVPLVDFVVAHGEHPDVTLWDHGYVPLRPLRAMLADGDVTVVFLIRPASRTDHPARRRPRVNDPDIAASDVPLPRQRLAAYAIVASSRGILGTVCSPRTNAPGVWMLPGGGLNDDESPSDAAIREVYEETGQRVRLDRLLTVQSDHWIGRAPDGTPEDFHALRIIYAATCDKPSDPVVHDRGGTTADAAWVPRSKWRALPWTAGARALLSQHTGHQTW